MKSSEQTTTQERVARLQSYATLINQKIIIPSDATSYFAVDRHFFVEVMAPLVEEIDLDERWYLSNHPDVQDAIERGLIQGARHHYLQYGFFEHRLPYRVEVDAPWYVSAYVDVNEAIQRQEYSSAQSHFELAGFREGRLPFANFALRARGGRRT